MPVPWNNEHSSIDMYRVGTVLMRCGCLVGPGHQLQQCLCHAVYSGSLIQVWYQSTRHLTSPARLLSGVLMAVLLRKFLCNARIEQQLEEVRVFAGRSISLYRSMCLEQQPHAQEGLLLVVKLTFAAARQSGAQQRKHSPGLMSKGSKIFFSAAARAVS